MRELLIESVGAQGDGLAAGPVYAPLTLPGERVLAAVEGERATVAEILTASADRLAPPCPYFGDCGGCALQHWAPSPYLAWKQDQIRLALARERIETEFLTPFASRPGTRRRLALHARKVGGRVALGFKARRTWRLVEIAQCPVALAPLQAALPALALLAKPFLEHPKSAPTLHATWTETGLDVDITGAWARGGGLSADARSRAAAIAAAGDVARVTLAGEILFQARQPIVRFGAASVALPPGAFLQAVAEAEAAMATVALRALDGASRVADLFCGVGAFALRLAEKASVYAADSSAGSVKALLSASGAPGLKAITAEARDLYRRPMLAEEMKRLDGVLFDPPRAGAVDQARQIARSGVGRVVGVSCNPATFARDARILVDAGFALREVTLIDQFLWSPHVELVGVFAR
jgi:23S rRNA (uracil1939-C5)-methyltransferase